MKTWVNWFFLMFVFTVFFSCKKSGTTETPPVITVDTTKPTISLADPTTGKSYVLGNILHLQMDLNDNVELKSYKVVIARSLKGLTTSDWAYSNSWTITSGKKNFTVNHNEIVVPLTVTGNQTTTGNYDLTITCLDVAGNEASTAVIIALTK